MRTGGIGPRSRLKARREELCRSLDQVARAVGVDRKTVWRWESGHNDPYRRQYPAIADALDWSLDRIDELLARDDPNRRQFVLAGLGTTLISTLTGLEAAATAASSDQQRQPVLVLLGHTHQALGTLAFDRLHYGAATEHFHSAHEIGVELGDADMVTAALSELGDVARRQGLYGTALRLLASTERHAPAAGALTQIMRCKTLARAHAEIGDRPAFDQTIDQAEQLASSISPDHHRDGDHSPRGVRLERGQGLTLLGDPRAALAIYADAAPPAFRPDRERGSFAIIEAQALAHAGHLDEGVRRAIEGLELARAYGSPRHVSRVQRMHDRLARTIPTADPRLAELHEALAA